MLSLTKGRPTIKQWWWRSAFDCTQQNNSQMSKTTGRQKSLRRIRSQFSAGVAVLFRRVSCLPQAYVDRTIAQQQLPRRSLRMTKQGPEARTWTLVWLIQAHCCQDATVRPFATGPWHSSGLLGGSGGGGITSFQVIWCFIAVPTQQQNHMKVVRERWKLHPLCWGALMSKNTFDCTL